MAFLSVNIDRPTSAQHIQTHACDRGSLYMLHTTYIDSCMCGTVEVSGHKTKHNVQNKTHVWAALLERDRRERNCSYSTEREYSSALDILFGHILFCFVPRDRLFSWVNNLICDDLEPLSRASCHLLLEYVYIYCSTYSCSFIRSTNPNYAFLFHCKLEAKPTSIQDLYLHGFVSTHCSFSSEHI